MQEYSLQMYSKYLVEVGKLAYIIGQIQTTSAFKKLLQSNNDTAKSRYFFKCMDELPSTTFKKTKTQCRRKGVLKCGWFNKMIDQSPMMIFMLFNYCTPLDPNEKWQDRLSVTIKKINKVYQVLRDTDKQQIVLKVIIIISKQSVLMSREKGNVIEIISQFLKAYQKQLSIYQTDMLTKQVSKNKSVWMNQIQRGYQKKFRDIGKRKQASSGERKLGCLIKMAVISQIINKKDSYTQYDEAYRSIHFKFIQTLKNKVQFYNFDSIRQLRILADIVLLRRMIVKMSISTNFQNVPDTISYHLKYFYQIPQNDHFFYASQNNLWRQNFLQNLIQVFHSNDQVQVVPKSFYVQLINSSISLSYKLCRASKQIQPILSKMQVKGRLIPIDDPAYIGSRNYNMGVDITDLDVVWTQMNELIDKKKDFIARGLQTITREKRMGTYKKHQISFLNIYLLRFYLADEKFASIGNIFNHIIKLKISEYDFYSLNYLIQQLQKQTENSQHRVLIHSLAVLIADFFKNKEQLQKYGVLLMKSLPNFSSGKQDVDLLKDISHPVQTQTQNESNINQNQEEPLILPLPSQSSIFSLQVLFSEKLHQIQNELEIKITAKFANNFLSASGKKAILKLFFNKTEIQSENQIVFNNSQIQKIITLKINPLNHFNKDETLQLNKAVLILKQNPEIHFLIENITFSKYRSVMLITKLKVPQISINMPYEIFYYNEIVKFTISASPPQPSTKMQLFFSVTQQPNNNTQIYVNLEQKLNLVNSNCQHSLSVSQPNIIYLKCNKIGLKALKFKFQATITQHIAKKQLKDKHIINKQLEFRIANLFKTMKILKEAYTGTDLKVFQIPINKSVIMSYHVKAVEAVHIIELGQHKSPKSYFKTHKNITPLSDFLLTPDQKLKNIYIFEVVQDQLKNQDKKQLFLISFYLKWNRTDMNTKLGLPQNMENTIVNVYNQDDVKISLKNDKVQVQYQQGKALKKRQKQTLSVKYRNLTSDFINVYATMDNSQQILRIGNRGSEVQLGPKQTKTITFQVLPVKSGYFKFPLIRNYFDGIQAKQKICTSIMCVL